MLGGDSAGGNLALELLSSLSHPRSDMPTIRSTEPVAATMLISPWVTFDTSAASFHDNQYADCVEKPALEDWSNAYLGEAAPDGYNSPLAAPKGWWKGLKSVELCIVYGEYEVFRDDITRFTEVLKVCDRCEWVSMVHSIASKMLY